MELYLLARVNEALGLKLQNELLCSANIALWSLFIFRGVHLCPETHCTLSKKHKAKTFNPV